MTTDIRKLLEEMVERRGSDLHLTSGVPPQIRIDGVLVAADRPPLSPEESRELSYAMIDEKRIARLESEKGLDTSHQRRGAGAVQAQHLLPARKRSRRGPTPAVGDSPDGGRSGSRSIMKEFCEKLNGLVLVSGPTGSGKSTTLASMLSHINEHEERSHPLDRGSDRVSAQAQVLDRQPAGDRPRRALVRRTPSARCFRQDPDVICIGEIRDLETVRTALTLAETGHLVLTTVHTSEAPQAISRIVDIFPPHEQQGVRTQISLSLEGVLVQQLLPDASGVGPRARDRADGGERGGQEPHPREQPAAASIGDRDGREGRHAQHELVAPEARAARSSITTEKAHRLSNDVKGIMRELARTT